MGVQLDHLVVLVEDLPAAVADYTAQGFIVSPGGTHTDGATANALVGFADGTYLELLAFLREAPEHRWWRYVAHGSGLIDFALVPDAIGETIRTAQQHGVAYTGPFDGGRVRPDGVTIGWQTGLPPSADLPFLCADTTPRERRVPHGAATAHPNGVRGIAGLTIACYDIAATSARYAALVGSSAARLGAATLHFRDATDRAAADRLASRGEGPLHWEAAST